jgi:hypothetical protein
MGPPASAGSTRVATDRAASNRLKPAVLLVLLALASCARHEFLRIREDSCEGRLEAAWVWFDAPEELPPVVLVNMIHLGSHEYYAEVQAELDRAALVFIEGIRCAPDGGAGDSRPRSGALARVDQATADLAFELRLTTQREALVPRDTFVCADWTEKQLLERCSIERYSRGVSCLRETVQMIVDHEATELRRRYPELPLEDLAGFVRRGPLRREVAERLTEAPVEDPAVIVGRNETLLRRLLTTGANGVVAICYGADHGPHLARSLETLGYRRHRQTWHRVFGFDQEPHPDVIPVP